METLLQQRQAALARASDLLETISDNLAAGIAAGEPAWLIAERQRAVREQMAECDRLAAEITAMLRRAP